MSVAFGTLIGGLGGEGSIVYWASRSKNSRSSWLTAIFFTGSLGSIAAALFWYVAYWRLHFSFLRGLTDSSARVVLFSIPAAILFSYAMALASGLEQFRLRSACAFSRQIILAGGFLLLFIAMGRTVNTALWGNFAGSLLAALIAFAFLWASVRKFSRFGGVAEHFKPTIIFGIRGQVGNLATFFNYRLDVFIVNYFLGPAQLGLYAVGVAVSEGLWQIPNAVASVLFPRTGRTVEQDATQFNCFILRQVFLITSLCAALIAIASPIAIPLLFGARFRPSVAVIWWILPGTVALSLAKVACSDLAGRGKNGYSSASAFVCFGATALLDWLLIPRMGILGASLASSISYTLDAALILIALQYETHVGWKQLFLPARADWEAYRRMSVRLRHFMTTLLYRRAGSEVVFSSQEGG
jgi:O-antigen/teichoic acid export membrane protein